MKKTICAISVILIFAAAFFAAALPISLNASFAQESSVENWTYNFEGTDWSNAPCSPVISGEYVIVFSGTRIYKLSLSSGEVVFSAETGYKLGFGVIAPTVDVSGKYIFMAFSDGVVGCFNFDDLSTKWIYHDEAGGQCNSPIVCQNNTVYTGFWKGETKDANYVAINALTGTAKWAFLHTGGFYWAGGVVVGQNIIIGADDGVGADNGNAEGILGNGKVYSISCSDGSVVDSYNVVGDQRSQITYLSSRKELLFTSKGGYLNSVLLRDDGKFEPRGTVDLLGTQSTSQPLVYNGRIYVCSGGGINKPGFVQVIDLGTLQTIYYIDSDYYPQCGVGLVPQGEDVDVYYNYNGYPGGIRKFTDNSETTSNVAVDYYIPQASMQQYCIGHLSIYGDKLVYKNDSCTVFCLSISASTGSKETVSSGFDVVNSCTLSALLEIMNADIDSLNTSDLYKMLLSSSFEYGEGSDYYNTLNAVYTKVLERDNEIAQLNKEIKENCADIHGVQLSDRKTVLSLKDRYDNLSDLNKDRVEGLEDLERAYDKVNTLYLAVILSCVLGTVTAGLVALIIIRMQKRKKAKAAAAMPESEE